MLFGCSTTGPLATPLERRRFEACEPSIVSHVKVLRAEAAQHHPRGDRRTDGPRTRDFATRCSVRRHVRSCDASEFTGDVDLELAFIVRRGARPKSEVEHEAQRPEGKDNERRHPWNQSNVVQFTQLPGRFIRTASDHNHLQLDRSARMGS